MRSIAKKVLKIERDALSDLIKRVGPDFEKTVNITLGLPFIRTSPGHGTGYDIAGKGIANPSGLIEAYRVAESMVY